jgi:glycosyltransferase involved in cell wall biosynthesis
LTPISESPAEDAGRIVVVDGRVFATEAADRGMGRYVQFIVSLLSAAGCEVTILLPLPDLLPRAWPAGVKSEAIALDDDPMHSSVALNRFLERARATLYVDATPFLPPARYDVYACPVISVLYDLIPMRFPNDYFQSFGPGPLDAYVNGMARVQKADHVIAISEHVRGQALRYLGIGTSRCTVITPEVGAEYRGAAEHAARVTPGAGGVFCIQGAHRSKNFPAAVTFLEQLSHAAGSSIDVVVPTPTQRTLVENARTDREADLRVTDSLSEQRKFALQRNARAIVHLSLEEGYGIPLAEALFLCRPIICLDTEINRELISGCDDPRAAGILLLEDLQLRSAVDLRAAAEFIRNPPSLDLDARRRIVAALLARRDHASTAVGRAIDAAHVHFDHWHERAGLAIVAPTEIGSCGVSDYCHALMRDTAPRYVVLLGPAPRELELTRHLRLVPLACVERVRARIPGMIFNLAVSESLTRAFDVIAEASSPEDVLVVHDAGSYLPGLLMQAAAGAGERLLFERYLRNEPDEVKLLSRKWLDAADRNGHVAQQLFLQMDRAFHSTWLRGFRGRLVSHHGAFARSAPDREDGILDQLPKQSEIRTRAQYAPMPIDVRANPGAARLADKMRWALGLARHDLLVCCAGSVVRGKYLDVVARVIAGLDEANDPGANAGKVVLMLAGRVLEDSLFAELRREFSTHNADARLVQIVEGNETRYDALLLASDVVIAFREQRRIQMSHSYVRALALGRPIITNVGAGFDDQDAAAVCRDECLEHDLRRHLLRLRDVSADRFAAAACSQAKYRARHTVDSFFANLQILNRAAAGV